MCSSTVTYGFTQSSKNTQVDTSKLLVYGITLNEYIFHFPHVIYLLLHYEL